MSQDFSELLRKPTHPHQPTVKTSQKVIRPVRISSLDQTSIEGSNVEILDPSIEITSDFENSAKNESIQGRKNDHLDLKHREIHDGLPQTFVPKLARTSEGKQQLQEDITQDFSDMNFQEFNPSKEMKRTSLIAASNSEIESTKLLLSSDKDESPTMALSTRAGYKKNISEKSLLDLESTWMEENHTSTKKHITIDVRQYEEDLLSLQRKQEYMFKALHNIRELQSDLRLKQEEMHNMRDSLNASEAELQKKEMSLKQKELGLLEQESRLHAQFLKQEQIQTYLNDAEIALNNKKKLMETEWKEKQDKLNTIEEEIRAKQFSNEKINTARMKELDQREQSIAIRTERVTEKEIRLENLILQHETALNLQRDLSSQVSVLKEKEKEIQNLEERIRYLINELNEKDAIIHKLTSLSNPNSSPNIKNNLTEKCAELESITLSLLQRKEELDRFEGELNQRQLSVEGMTPEETKRYERLQSISLEFKRVLQELQSRERNLNVREVKLKDMVLLVQSIQNRQQLAKDELNRAIQKDEKKIQEKIEWIQEREIFIEKTQKAFTRTIDELVSMEKSKPVEDIVNLLLNTLSKSK